jgi:hypothetical protein
LELEDTQVNARGLKHLKHLSKLELLCIPASGLSAAAIEEFEKSLPNVQVNPPPKSRL